VFRSVSLPNCLSSIEITTAKFTFLPENQIPDFIGSFSLENILGTATHELYGQASDRSLIADYIETGVTDLCIQLAKLQPSMVRLKATAPGAICPLNSIIQMYVVRSSYSFIKIQMMQQSFD
jgi:hypothetical protein